MEDDHNNMEISDCDVPDSKTLKSLQFMLGIGKSNSSKQPTQDGPLLAGLHIHEYKMDHARRGKCLIFYHNTMPKIKDHEMEDRISSNIDYQNLNRVFTNLGFEVESCENFTAKQIKRTLKKVSKEDHSDADCFACCLITRGDKGVYFASDKSYSQEILWKYFLGDECHKTLIGKPKLFFIEAYQGEEVDTGDVCDGHASKSECISPRIPSHADFLLVNSTVNGYYSWINGEKGSWFVQSLCECLEEHYQSEDILDILTAVNNKVAYSFESKTENPSENGFKQMPVFTSMLTKKLYLKPKSMHL